MTPAKPNIFAFTSYRAYLRAHCDFYVASSGKSLRAFSRKCGISSPNYFQQVIAEKRNLTRHFALKFGKGAELPSLETDYLLEMVRLNHADDAEEQQKALAAMRNVVRRARREKVKDRGIYSSWLNGVIWELAKTKLFSPESRRLKELLRAAATETEVGEALRFLIKKGYIKESSDGYAAAPIDFEPSNDIRRIDLQRSHLRFLQLAQHRVSDALADRELQGLTVAVKREDFEKMRQRCRDFIMQLNTDFAVDADGDEVLRVQLSMFKLTSPGS